MCVTESLCYTAGINSVNQLDFNFKKRRLSSFNRKKKSGRRVPPLYLIPSLAAQHIMDINLV